VMVGFPGETVAEFEETRRMVEELPFTYLHVFTYSARPGTPAAQLKQQVAVTVAKERNAALRGLAAAKRNAFIESLVGREVEAITLQTGGADFTDALTENYLKVRLAGRLDANRWLKVRIEGIERGLAFGAPIENRSIAPTERGRQVVSFGHEVTRECTN